MKIFDLFKSEAVFEERYLTFKGQVIPYPEDLFVTQVVDKDTQRAFEMIREHGGTITGEMRINNGEEGDIMITFGDEYQEEDVEKAVKDKKSMTEEELIKIIQDKSTPKSEMLKAIHDLAELDGYTKGE